MYTARTRDSIAALLLLLLLAPALAHAATRYDPRLRFRTYRTAHFDVHAHQGEEALARRLAAIAERVCARFEPTLGLPRGRVQVILVDQTDVSNGWANPFPYDAIEISAAPPAGEELIGNTTDWLEIAFTHEYTHVLHLDRSRGFMGGVRRVFGRAPLVFPNLFLPVWQIEGFATYEESRMTGEGRVPAGDFRALVDVPARQRRFEPIDRAGGGLDDWPNGHAPYAYGAYFHQYLSDRFGADRVEALADATAARLPLLGATAFKPVLGASVGSLWRDFRESREHAEAVSSATDTAARRLTHHGYTVAAPRVGEDGAVYYRRGNADGFPALMRLEGGTARRLAWRVGGGRTSVRGAWIVFDQIELTRSVALYSDLYAMPRAGGRVIRLTKDARAGYPDLSPDGRRIACVVQATGRRALAILDFLPQGPRATPHVIAGDPGADYVGPRWSPDGSTIVAERHRGGTHELVLVDPATGETRVLLARTDARLVTPSWTPDGSTVLFAANVGGAPFNVFAVDVRSAAVRRITDSASGAQSPEMAPDGSLIYLGYTADGYDLFSLPADFRLAPATASAPLGSFGSSGLQAGDHVAAPQTPAADEISSLKPGAYRPFRTLVPTYWEPVIASDAGETVVGAATSMSDALGRHGYSTSVAWAAPRARPDWSLGYAYDRWRPTIVASYSDDTDPIDGGDVRSRELFAGALLPFRRIRWSHTLMAGFDADTQTVECRAACPADLPRRRDLRSVRGGWLYDSRRLFGYSVSTEEGFAVEAAIEGSRRALGSDFDANAAIFDARAFQRVFSRHTVIAVRLAAASSWGETGGRRRFSAAGPGPSNPSFDFGRDTIGLLRGFDPEDVVGPHAAVLNADLRVPLLRVQRGPGLWPVFMRSLHAAAFVDLGHAWDATFRAADVRRGVGGELATDIVLIHYVPLTIAGGVAWTRDPAADRDRVAPFVRLGYAF
jgi:WD40-like Beta Propeller Repeat